MTTAGTRNTPKPATTPPSTPLPRTQDEIVTRLQRYMDRAVGDPAETRHVALAQALDRAHAAHVIDHDVVDVNDYPETAPGREHVMHGLVTHSLPALLRQAQAVRQSIDMLAEQAWLLGRPDVAEAMVPGVHAEAGHSALVALVRFTTAFSVPLPGEGTETGVAADLAAALETAQEVDVSRLTD